MNLPFWYATLSVQSFVASGSNWVWGHRSSCMPQIVVFCWVRPPLSNYSCRSPLVCTKKASTFDHVEIVDSFLTMFVQDFWLSLECETCDMMDPTKQLAGSCRAVSMSTSMWATVAAIRSSRSPICRRSLCCCFAPDSDGRGLLFLDLKKTIPFL